MTNFEDAIHLIEHLSVVEKVQLIEHLSASLRNDLEEGSFQRLSWHEFVDRTSGILADDPIERPPQLPYEEREAFE